MKEETDEYRKVYNVRDIFEGAAGRREYLCDFR